MFKIANAITNFSAGLKPAHHLASAVEDGLPAIQNGSFFSLLGGSFWSGLWLTICTAISTFFYGIIRWVLNIVDFLQFFVTHLIGLDYWQEGNVSTETLGESDIIFKFLYDDTVQRVFKYMLGIFVVLLILFSIIAIIKNEYAVATDQKAADTMTIIKRACKAIFLVVLVPVMLVMGLLASNAVLAGLANAFSINSNQTLGGQVFTSSAYSANRYRDYADNDIRYAVSNEVWVEAMATGDSIENSKIKTQAGTEGRIKLKIQTTVTPVVPKDYDEDNHFVGFMFRIDDSDYLYAIDFDDDYEKNLEIAKRYYNHYVKYFKDVLGATLKKGNDVSAIYNSYYPYIIEAALSEKESNSALNVAAYNSWQYNSIYYNHSSTFDKTVTSTVKPYSADSGNVYSDAKKYENNTVWGAMHDGGTNGLVALRDEYYVVADLIEFAVSGVTSIAFVNVNSPAIYWDYSGKDKQGYLSARYINSNKSPTTGKISSLNSFVVNYKDSGYVIYDNIANDKTAETDGAIYIAAYYSSSLQKYIPIVNNKYYVDDYGDSHRFISEYLDSDYQGLVVVRGVLDPEFSNQYGYPTEIDVDWSSSVSGVSEGVVSLLTPKYFTTSVVDVKSEAFGSGTSTISKPFKSTLTVGGNVYPIEGVNYSNFSTDEIKTLASSALPSTMKYRYKTSATTYSNKTTLSASWSYVGESLSSVSESSVSDSSQKYKVFYSNVKMKNFDSDSSSVKEYPLYAFAYSSSSSIYIDFAIANSTDAGRDYFINNEYNTTNRTKIRDSSSTYPYFTDLGAKIENKSVSTGGETYFATTEKSSGEFSLTAKKLVKSFDDSSNKLLDYVNIPANELANTEYSGSLVYYYFNSGPNTTTYRVTHDTANYNLKFYDNTPTYDLKIGGVDLTTRTIYDMKLSSIDDVYHIFETEISNINYYFKFEYDCSAGIETYTPQSSNYYKVTINQYNIFTFNKSGIKQLNPVSLEFETGKEIGTKVAFIDENAITAKYIAKDENDYIHSLTLRLQDEDKSLFATVYVKTDSKDKIESNYDNYIKNDSYMVTINSQSLSKLPDYSSVTDDAEIKKMGLSTTATVIFKRQKVKANQFKSDIQIALFSKNTTRFKIAFFSTYSASQDEKSSFKIIGARLLLDYNFISTFASGLTVSTFYVPMELNFVILIFAACLILSILGKAVWGVIQRIFDITVYFVILPGVASVMPFDDGSRFSTWSSNVVKKVFGAYGVILGLNLFFVLIPPIKNISHLFTAEDLATLSEGNFLRSVSPGFVNSVSELLFTLVALTMIQTLPGLIMEMLGKDYGKSDVVKVGEATKSSVQKMSKEVGDTISGKKALEFALGQPDKNGKRQGGFFNGQLKNFIPGSAIYDDIKRKINPGRNDVDPVKDSDKIAQEAAEARRRADADAAMAQAESKIEEATKNPGTQVEEAKAEAMKNAEQQINQQFNNGIPGTQADSQTETQSENAQTSIPDEQKNDMANKVGEKVGEEIDEMLNKDQDADQGSETENGAGQTGSEGDEGDKGEEGKDGKSSDRAKYAEVAGKLENPEDVNVSFAGAGDADEGTEAQKDNETSDETPNETPDESKSEETTQKEFDSNSVEDWQKESDETQKQIDEWQRNLDATKALKTDEFTTSDDTYFGYDKKTGDFIYRRNERELKGVTDGEEKTRISKEIKDYNENYDYLDNEQHRLEEKIRDAKEYQKEIADVIADLNNKQAEEQAEQTEQKIDEKVNETTEQKVEEKVDEKVDEKSEEKTEESEKSDQSEKAEQAETAKTAQTSGDAEKAKLYTEAAKLYAEAAKGYADVATGKVDKNYGVDTRTRDQKKLDELKAKREKRLQEQASGNADTGLSILQRKKAYEQFNKDKDVKDTIFSENEEAVKKAAIVAWNTKGKGTTLNIKKSAKKDIDAAVQKWKDERAVELYNKKHGSNVTADKLTGKQRKEARQLLDSDQYIKKATARSEFRDEKLDNAIAKQQEKIDLKAQGLYESGLKKVALALPRVLSHKTTEKEEEKLQEKLDKWEAVGREKKEQLEALNNKERLEKEIEEFKKNNTSRDQGSELKLQKLKKELEVNYSALTDKDGNALNLDKKTLEKDLAEAQKRFDAYSAQMQNGRSGLGVAFARETASGARFVKSNLQSFLANELNNHEDKLNKKITGSVTLGENFDAKKYLTDSSYTGKEKFTEEHKKQLDARISAVDNAIIEKRNRQKDLERRGLVVNTDGSINYEKSKAKMGDKFSKETVDSYYNEYNTAEERVKASKKNLTEMFNNFNKEDENSYAKLKTRLDRTTLARVKAEKAKVVDEFNRASKSGRLEEAQEKAMLDKIQGYDRTIELFQSKTARYKSTKLTAFTTKVGSAATKVGNVATKFTQKVQGVVGSMKPEKTAEGTRVKKLSNKELAQQALANADVVAGRKTQISERDKAGLERTAEKIGKEEARKTMLNETAQRDYINKIRKTLAQSGFAGDITKITNAQSAKEIRDNLERDLMNSQKKTKDEIKKLMSEKTIDENKVAQAKLQEKLIEQKLKKLRKVDVDISALGNSVNIRNEIKSATDKTKFRSEYIKGWNEYVKSYAKDPKLNARSGSVAYEKSQKLTAQLSKEVADLNKQIDALKRENKTDSIAFRDLEKRFDEQNKKYQSLKTFNDSMNSKLKSLDSKTNKTTKSTMTMERIMKDMRRESKYKIKGITNSSDKKD